MSMRTTWFVRQALYCFLVVVLVMVVGCDSGTTTANTGGVGGVVTLGPRPVGGGPSDGGDTDYAAPDEGAQSNEDDQPDTPTPDEGSDGGDGSDEVDDGDGGSDVDDGDDGFDGFDACGAVDGRSFFTPSASLSFVDATFIWTVGGEQSTGVFTCAGLDLTGRTPGGDVFTGRYDPLNDMVSWEGSIYRPDSTH